MGAHFEVGVLSGRLTLAIPVSRKEVSPSREVCIVGQFLSSRKTGVRPVKLLKMIVWRGGTHFLRPPLCSELMDYRYKNMLGDRFICSGVGNLPPGVKLTKAECAKLR